MKRFALTLGSMLLVLSAGLATVVVIKSLDKTEPANNGAVDMGATPDLIAQKVLDGLDHPWDIDFLPDNTMLFTERSGGLYKFSGGNKTKIEAISDVRSEGEGGLLGLAIDPEFTTNKFIYTCLNTVAGDIKVVRWSLNAGQDGLQDRRDIIVGIPSNPSGRHSGCQLAFGPDKNLWVGTGDAADEKNPQNQSSLGGKILRVDRDGTEATGNPIGPDRRIYSYGHRNLQAIAFYKTKQDKSYGISVEHGPDRDDEVNELQPGNFGWAPGPGYDESVPMTNTRDIPDTIGSIWSTAMPTIAPSGAAFLRGQNWGRFEDWLAVSVLKDQKLLLLNVTGGSVDGVRTFFENKYGRMRAATMGPGGALYVSTDHGANDVILKITP